jgi:hypothetical protein
MAGRSTFAFSLFAALALASWAAPKTAMSADAPRQAARTLGPDGKEAKLVAQWDPSALPQREWAPWLGYLLARVQYRDKNNITESHYGVQPTSFEEEVWARDAAGQIYIELRQKEPDLDVVYFNDLARVRVAGFIREYVWVFLYQASWPDPGNLRVKEFEEWRRANLAGHRVVTYGALSLEPQ